MADDFTGADPKIPDRPVKTALLWEVETASRLAIELRFGDSTHAAILGLRCCFF